MKKIEGEFEAPISSLFPDHVKKYPVGSLAAGDERNSFLHQHFYQPLSLSSLHHLHIEISDLLSGQDADAIYDLYIIHLNIILKKVLNHQAIRLPGLHNIPISRYRLDAIYV